MPSEQPQDVLLATTNPAKAAKLAWALAGLGLSLRTLRDIPPALEPEETGVTFEENARIKAACWSRRADCLAMASDGGAAIPVLGERWNALQTRRNAGEHATDEERIQRLLDMMQPCHGQERRIYWTEALAVAERGRALASWRADGDEGYLAERYDPARRRIPGFWVASLFYYPRFGKCYAELSPVELAQVDTSWRTLKERAQAWFKDRWHT
ncbi:MAG: non-canonical purine NTP pyrophosphatase [Dehalococcoidia bacterium]|nr:non-canonical purine NTP pyrophosphatase [Dehalococcoidia bacterium]